VFFDEKNARFFHLCDSLSKQYLQDEDECVQALLAACDDSEETAERIVSQARVLVHSVREQKDRQTGIEAFMHEYGLSSSEGVVLMCLAEALLRIPDKETADRLIRDKLSTANWQQHLGHSHSLFVNASTWGLLLTRNVVAGGFNGHALFGRLLARAGEPFIRSALKQAMRLLGHQFVMGNSIESALSRSQNVENESYRYSFDMLGEAALTEADAQHYLSAYEDAIIALGGVDDQRELMARPSISVKLSALHPRYEFSQQQRVVDELSSRLLRLARLAQQQGVGLTVDAEEAERLELSLAIYENVAAQLGDWSGFGLAIQAYQKRALDVLRWLAELSRQQGRRIPVRLVKGAYWDTEIKRAQERGLAGYPVFTRKENTDVSYLVCARFMLNNLDAFYPQFATHNAHTLASIMEYAPSSDCFEYQRLHGMGEALYEQVLSRPGYACRVYAPVGSYQELLPYLVRRLLENGANTSFVNSIEDADMPIDEVVRDPVKEVAAQQHAAHDMLPMPSELFGISRLNSRGLNLFDQRELSQLSVAMNDFLARPYCPASHLHGEIYQSINPATAEVVGEIVEATAEDVSAAMCTLHEGFHSWQFSAAEERAEILRNVAHLYESHTPQLVALIVAEAGRNVEDALSELREAVDFCRYYAQQALSQFAEPISLPGPTGESNELRLQGRGVFACISPWNFPVAIFTGQVSAALAAGNVVLAKPARQTPLAAAYCAELMYQAGVPRDVLRLVCGPGAMVGEQVLTHQFLSGVAFTGSTQVARHINQTLAQREGAILPLIAETGGLNMMLTDSSALPEQVVNDVIFSAFNSAGQRCSALRVLLLQKEIAPRVTELLKGAMAELNVGDPLNLANDVGPVIDASAAKTLQAHVKRMDGEAELLAQANLDASLAGSFFAPRLYKIRALSQLQEEVFGPVLHVLEYDAEDLGLLIAEINASGYGLTLGIHSRVDETVRYIQDRVKVGNVYVNRNMIGAVVGVQPFGGEGLSGTGPKAGGPHYLLRFANEQTLSNNTAAMGGNVSLLGGID
jgi:RHH-type proline utilization regulon transcriptional repressor/proline dehydrogenase/delta 1-pyrroline-5-carboxylate dehydrogenase